MKAKKLLKSLMILKSFLLTSIMLDKARAKSNLQQEIKKTLDLIKLLMKKIITSN